MYQICSQSNRRTEMAKTTPNRGELWRIKFMLIHDNCTCCIISDFNGLYADLGQWSNTLDSNTVYDASQIGPACYQSLPQSLYEPYNDSFAFTPQGVSENCLTVDVLVPTHPTSQYLPVMVQIHGGGYTSGSAQSYPGDAMVNASNGNANSQYASELSMNT